MRHHQKRKRLKDFRVSQLSSVSSFHSTISKQLWLISGRRVPEFPGSVGPMWVHTGDVPPAQEQWSTVLSSPFTHPVLYLWVIYRKWGVLSDINSWFLKRLFYAFLTFRVSVGCSVLPILRDVVVNMLVRKVVSQNVRSRFNGAYSWVM